MFRVYHKCPDSIIIESGICFHASIGNEHVNALFECAERMMHSHFDYVPVEIIYTGMRRHPELQRIEQQSTAHNPYNVRAGALNKNRVMHI